MANKKISALTAASTPTGAEIMPAVQSGGNVGLTVTQILAAVFPGFISGNWYSEWMGSTAVAGGAALVANTAYFVPVVIPALMSVQGLACKVTGAGSTSLQLALYANNAATGRPTGSPLVSTSSITDTSTGPASQSSLGPASCSPGIYWFGINTGDASPPTVLVNLLAAPSLAGAMIGSATLSHLTGGAGTAALQLYLTTPLTYGTWGSLTSATWTEVTPTSAATNIGSVVAFLQSS